MTDLYKFIMFNIDKNYRKQQHMNKQTIQDAHTNTFISEELSNDSFDMVVYRMMGKLAENLLSV